MIIPKISVILPVFNGEKTIFKAIDSILSQSFKDFELIIINDGSTDSTSNIIESFKDERVKIISVPINKGIVNSLNLGINAAKGQYIARMDSDDVSHPQRFQIQLEYLEAHPDTVLCGSWIKNISSNKIWKYRPSSKEIWTSSLFAPAMAHPTWMGKTSLFKELNYNNDFPFMEDWDFFMRIPHPAEFHNIQEVLLDYGTVNKTIKSPPRELILKFYQTHLPNLFTNPKDFELFIDLNFYPERIKISPKSIRNVLEKLSLYPAFEEISIEKQQYYVSKYSGTWFNKLIWKWKLKG